jgi:signal peptidase I
MQPTIPIGSRVTVNRLVYQHHAVRVGDIIVFASPPNEDCGGPFVSDLIKRVIGLPGQTISLSGGHVLTNGKRLHETWLPPSVRGTTFPGPSGTHYNLTQAYRVPADDYFVLGDNRADSCDSRYFGPIPKDLIVGKVTATVISIEGS